MNSKIAEQISIIYDKLSYIKKENIDLNAINKDYLIQIERINSEILYLKEKLEESEKRNEFLQNENFVLQEKIKTMSLIETNEKSENEIHQLVMEIDYCIEKLKKIDE